MPAELLIRPGHQDNLVVADLLAVTAPRPGTRPPMSRLVLDATVAAARSSFAEDARAAGLSVSVDPMTFLMQAAVAPANAWARLPFAPPMPLSPGDLTPRRRRELIASIVTFQLEQGATVITPPYFHSIRPSDPWFEATLACVLDTVNYLRDQNINIPVMPVLSGRLQYFGREDMFETGLDRFADTANQAGARTVVTQLGPAGQPKDNVAKVLALLQAGARLRRPGLGVHAWRQGTYGPALVAVGYAGYESGIAMGEATNIAGAVGSRRPKPAPDPDGGGAGGGQPAAAIFLPQLGRSVPVKNLEIARRSRALRALLLCDDTTNCCQNGLDMQDGRRAHSVRARARYLTELDRMPAQPAWRLNKISQDARGAAVLLGNVNDALADAGAAPVPTQGQTSLADAAESLGGMFRAVA